MLHEEQLKTPDTLDENAGMSLITNKSESSLDMHNLEKFIDEKYCETRQQHGINHCDSSNISRPQYQVWNF